jgi:predicted DNA-binding WGR domain protein
MIQTLRWTQDKAEPRIRHGECSRRRLSLHFVLERVDPFRNIARSYVLSIEPTLFSKYTLILRWGRIGSLGRERLQFFWGDDVSQAQVTLETWLARKRKRGYAPRIEPARPPLFFHKRASS